MVIKFDSNLYSNNKRRKKRIRVMEFGTKERPTILMNAHRSAEYIQKRNTFDLTDQGVILELTPIREEFQELFSKGSHSEYGCHNWGYALLFYDESSISKLVKLLNHCRITLIKEKMRKLAKEEALLEMYSSDVQRYLELDEQLTDLNSQLKFLNSSPQ